MQNQINFYFRDEEPIVVLIRPKARQNSFSSRGEVQALKTVPAFRKTLKIVQRIKIAYPVAEPFEMP
jgi:hypothetical protein